MKTVSYSLDDETADGIAEMAAQYKVSRSDIVRMMYARMRFEKTAAKIRADVAPLLEELGLETEDDIAAYAKYGPDYRSRH